jgi:hypothetical protein
MLRFRFDDTHAVKNVVPWGSRLPATGDMADDVDVENTELDS